jgi:hypothetical protein
VLACASKANTAPFSEYMLSSDRYPVSRRKLAVQIRAMSPGV